jgi:voltage-gated potassium channel
MLLFKFPIKAVKSPDFWILALLAAATVATGTIVFHLIEGLRWLDSLYFTVITLTTVGYGDISPQTDGGKMFAIFYIIVGLGIMAALIGVVADIIITTAKEEREQRRSTSS